MWKTNQNSVKIQNTNPLKASYDNMQFDYFLNNISGRWAWYTLSWFLFLYFIYFFYCPLGLWTFLDIEDRCHQKMCLSVSVSYLLCLSKSRGEGSCCFPSVSEKLTLPLGVDEVLGMECLDLHPIFFAHSRGYPLIHCAFLTIRFVSDKHF